MACDGVYDRMSNVDIVRMSYLSYIDHLHKPNNTHHNKNINNNNNNNP